MRTLVGRGDVKLNVDSESCGDPVFFAFPKFHLWQEVKVSVYEQANLARNQTQGPLNERPTSQLQVELQIT